MKTMRFACFLFAVLLVGCPGAGPKGPAREMSENWLVTYLGDTKIGYSVFRRDRVGDEYHLENVMRMQVTMSGKAQEVRYASEVVTGLDHALRTVSFDYEVEGRAISMDGRVEAGKLVIESEGAARRTIPLEGSVYPMSAVGQLVMKRKPAKDSVYRFQVFDASVMSVAPVEVTVLGRERVKLGGEEYEGLKVRIKLAKIEMVSWLDDDGMTLVEISPPGMRSERTTPQRAMAIETGQGRLDLLRMFRVPVDTVVADPSVVRRAKLIVSGPAVARFDFAAGNQTVKTRGDEIEVEVVTPGVPASVTFPIAGQDAFLRPSLTVQSDHPDIVARAREAVGEPKDAVAAARKLTSWVFTVVEKEMTASFPSALDVLKNMRGDCNEHSVFYAALARAIGIPAKVVVGLVYMDGAFYYHAWNEVFLGDWIPIDATLGEFPAGALRLKLGEGELSEQAQILAVVGEIGIRVVEFGP